MNQSEFDFNHQLVQGSVKKAMAAAQASSSDLWKVSLQTLRILPNFNVRVHDDAYKEHLASIVASMKANGYRQDRLMTGFVAIEDGQQIIYVTDGHTRYEAAKIAVSEGAEIPHIPIVILPQGTNVEDLTAGLVTSNSGKPLSPYEVGIVCKRLIGFGWEPRQIGERLSFTEQYVNNLLVLMAAPKEIRDMVQSGQVAASTAVAVLTSHGDKAVEHLLLGLNRAKSAGGSRVTAKHLPGSFFTKSVKKAAPKLFSALSEVKQDPAYQSISPKLRVRLEELITQLETAKEKDATTPVEQSDVKA